MISGRLSAWRPAVVEHLLEAPAWLERLAVPRVINPLIHFVDLFQADFARLVYHAPHKEDGDDAKGAPNEKDLGAKGGVAWASANHERSAIRNAEVENPVRSCRYRHGLGSYFEGVYLGGDDPDDWTPGRGEEGDVDGAKGNQDGL